MIRKNFFKMTLTMVLTCKQEEEEEKEIEWKQAQMSTPKRKPRTQNKNKGLTSVLSKLRTSLVSMTLMRRTTMELWYVSSPAVNWR